MRTSLINVVISTQSHILISVFNEASKANQNQSSFTWVVLWKTKPHKGPTCNFLYLCLSSVVSNDLLPVLETYMLFSCLGRYNHCTVVIIYL